MPVLTVVTATFNRIDSLRKNIDSVKNQTFKNIEHIIVDNLSSDGTDRFINDYRKSVRYKVIYIREKDNGIYQAMNKGIKASGGEWVHILNSDDVYKNKNVLNEIFKNDLRLYDVIATSIEYKKNGKVNRWVPQYERHKRHYNFPHPGIIIKREFYNKYGFYSEKFKLVSDGIFMAENFRHAKIKVFKLSSVLMQGGGFSSVITLNNLRERLISILHYHKFPISFKIRLIFYLMADLAKSGILWQKKNGIHSNRKIS